MNRSPMSKETKSEALCMEKCKYLTENVVIKVRGTVSENGSKKKKMKVKAMKTK